jgi:regulator of protease activity HflC (stomatin/prohibitin superfamily)
METAFGWLGQIFEAMLQFIPRLVIVRNTHQAVKWKPGGKVVPIAQGRRTWYWPWLTEIDTIVVARQTLNLATQCLMTSDHKTIVVGGFIVYHINDVVKAIGERNWDVESTVSDITMSAILESVMQEELDYLMSSVAEGIDGEFNKALTDNSRKQLRQFGVYVDRAGLTDFSTCRVHKILGSDIRAD